MSDVASAQEHSSPRHGMTIPFDGIALRDHRELVEELEQLGYEELWTSETAGTDAFTPLAMAATWSTKMRLGTAVVPAFTRGPALLASSVAALAEAAPGRVAFGVGTSSEVIVEHWNGIRFAEPYRRARDILRFLRAALAGEKVSHQYDTFEVRGFRLERPPTVVPPLLLAALRPGMLRLAGHEADGAIINWLSVEDVSKVVAEVEAGAGDSSAGTKEIVARIFVCPNPDAELVRSKARKVIAGYLNVPVYAAFHAWLGRGEQLSEMWEAWQAGDRARAVAAIPDSVVDELIVHGSPEACRAHLQRYMDAGVTSTALLLLPFGVEPRRAIRDLAFLRSAIER